MATTSHLLPHLVELYLHGDPPNAWAGKFAEHDPDPCGHSEAINFRCALKHQVDTVIDLPAGDDRATRLGLTLAARRAGEETAAKVAGHTSSRTTRQHYIDAEVLAHLWTLIWAMRRPRRSLLSSANSSTNARPARMAPDPIDMVFWPFRL